MKRFPVLIASNFEQFGFANDFGRKVWDIVIVGKTLNPHVIEGPLLDKESLVATADHDSSRKDQVKTVGCHTSDVQNRVD